MSEVSEFHVKGGDGITRGLNEHYDNQKDVEQDPYGAWLAIQNLWTAREASQARIAELEAALRFYAGESIDMSIIPEAGGMVYFGPGNDGGGLAREALKGKSE